MTKITIIIPIYIVQEQYLRDCLNSVITQDLQEIECLLISDGAPEAESSICEEFVKKDSRFKFLKKDHAGVSAARNYGINHARGEYITFVDSDDWIAPDTCTKTYLFAKATNSDIVLWNLATTTENKKIICEYKTDFRTTNKVTEKQNFNLQRSSIIQGASYDNGTCIFPYYSAKVVCCKLIKKSIIMEHNLSYNESLTLSEDRLFNFDLLRCTKKIAYLDEVLYFYRTNPKSASQKYTPNSWERQKLYYEFIKQKAPNSFRHDIATALIREFFASWKLCYMNKSNRNSLSQRISALKKIWNSALIQESLPYVDTKMLNLTLQLEFFFLRRNFFLLVWLHGVKNRL